MRRQASSSRVPVITTNGHEMNRKFSDNMENEYSIEAFRQKLDELTESLDHNINFEKIIQDAKNTTPVKQIMSLQSQPQSAGMSAIASSSDDPILVQTAPQLRRLPMTAVTDFTDNATTTTNRTSHISSQQSSLLSSNRNTTRGIASPEPPTPVKTPLRRQNHHHQHHPDRSTTPSSSVQPERRLPGPQPRMSTVESTTTNPSPLPSTRTASSRPPDPSRATMGATATNALPLPHPDTTTTTPETRMPPPQRQWNELFRTLQQHEERIRQLEYENDQAWLFQQQPSRQTTATYDAGGSSSRSHRSSHRRRYPEDPGIRHFVSTTATPSFSSDHVRGGHDHHHQSNSNRPLGSTASPGQRFVEELVQIMDLPSDLHEPLSRIMDRQFYSGNGSL